MIHYLTYLIIKFILILLKYLPLRINLFLGKMTGLFLYFLPLRQKQDAYCNIKAALSSSRNPAALRKILRNSYCHLGMNLGELVKFSCLSRSYIDKYIDIQGEEYIKEAKRQNKGIVFLTAHLGNWELSAQIASLLGYPMKVLAQRQRHSRLNNLLNEYRSSNNCQVITKGFGIKKILRSLKDSENLGILADQDSSQKGVSVQFLGRQITTPSGPISIAQTTDAVVIPSFIIRKEGPYHLLHVHQPLNINKTGHAQEDIQHALQKFHDLLSRYIKDNPEQWLWMQNKWKTCLSRSIAVLSDKKKGHLNQSLAVARLLKKELNSQSFTVRSLYSNENNYKIIEVDFKNKMKEIVLKLITCLRLDFLFSSFGVLKFVLKKNCYNDLVSLYSDYVISCGNSLAPINLMLSKENRAKNIIIMKPPCRRKEIDLSIIPFHDRPILRENVVITDGAPSIYNEDTLQVHTQKLKQHINLSGKVNIGLFFGGNNAYYQYTSKQIDTLLSKIKKAAGQLKAEVLATTSRRTTRDFEHQVEKELGKYENCKFLVIANRFNPSYAVGGILGVSDVVIVSFDSISMISEAASAGRYVVVAMPEDVSLSNLARKHARMIENFKNKGYIRVSNLNDIDKNITDIVKNKPEFKKLNDNENIITGLRQIL